MNRWECQNCGASGPLLASNTCESCRFPSELISQRPIEPIMAYKPKRRPKIPEEIKNNAYLVARWICEKW